MQGCTPWCARWGQRATFRSGFFPSLVWVWGKQTQVIRLGDKHLHILSRITSPYAPVFKYEASRGREKKTRREQIYTTLPGQTTHLTRYLRLICLSIPDEAIKTLVPMTLTIKSNLPITPLGYRYSSLIPNHWAAQGSMTVYTPPLTCPLLWCLFIREVSLSCISGSQKRVGPWTSEFRDFWIQHFGESKQWCYEGVQHCSKGSAEI